MEVGASLRGLVNSIAGRRIYRDVTEIGVVALAFLLYFIVRGGVVDRDSEAQANAADIIDLPVLSSGLPHNEAAIRSAVVLPVDV